MEFFIIAEEVSVDQQTNRLSLFNVLEQVASPNFPVRLLSALAVSLWMAEEGDDNCEFQCMLHIILPNGDKLNVPSNFTFPAHARRHRVLQRIQGIPLDGPGVLRFEIFLNGEYQASHVVDIEMMPAADLPPIVEAG